MQSKSLTRSQQSSISKSAKAEEQRNLETQSVGDVTFTPPKKPAAVRAELTITPTTEETLRGLSREALEKSPETIERPHAMSFVDRYEWEKLGQDIDHLKYEMTQAMGRRIPKFDYDFPLIGAGSQAETFEEEREQEAHEVSFGEGPEKGKQVAKEVELKPEIIKRRVSKEKKSERITKGDKKLRELRRKFGRKEGALMARWLDKHCWNCFGKDLLFPPQELNPLWIK